MSLENLFNAIKINRGEKETSRDEILDSIRFSQIENPLESAGVIKMISDYSLQMKEKFEKENPKTAEVEVILHLVDVYFEAGFTDIALTSLAGAKEKANAIGDKDLINKVSGVEDLLTETLRR